MAWITIRAAAAFQLALVILPLHAAEEYRTLQKLAAWVSPQLHTIKAELARIDTELAQLPAPAGSNSSTHVGYRSSDAGEEEPWIEIEFPAPVHADRIVLVPTLTQDTRGRVASFGFPKRFMLEAQDPKGKSLLLRDESQAEFPDPGYFPVETICPTNTTVSRIRLTVTESWEQDGLRSVSLSEIMILDGNRNIAPQGHVLTSNSRETQPVWSRSNLTDNITPLGLPLQPDGSKKLGWHSEAGIKREETKSVTVDLGKVMPIDEVRIVPAWQDNVFGWNNYGLPIRFKIEAATTAEFKDPLTIVDYTGQSLQTPGRNLQIYPANEMPGRFIRVTATRMRKRSEGYVFALGELQIYSGGFNRALGCKVSSAESIESDVWGRAALTDGHTDGAHLIELPAWIAGLAKTYRLRLRRDLLKKRYAEIADRLERELLTASLGTATVLVILAGFLAWRSRHLRILDRERHRERLARDLHDELGSNLGSIALISAFSNKVGADREQMSADLHTIEAVARESADSMRDMVALLGRHKRKNNREDWLVVMKNLAERLLVNAELECQLPSAPLAWEPNLETRREIYIFCKEVLHNAARHGRPTHVRFHLGPKPNGLGILIEDDGSGFDPTSVELGHGLGNLRERASIMKAEMTLTSSPGTGTRITLDIPRSRRWTRA